MPCSSYKHEAVALRWAEGVHACAQPSSGLRDNEVRLATRAIKRGPPCLRLFGEHGVEGRAAEGRHTVDIYDSFADMFTVLPVRLVSLPLPDLFLVSLMYMHAHNHFHKIRDAADDMRMDQSMQLNGVGDCTSSALTSFPHSRFQLAHE